MRILLTGSTGQLGKALLKSKPNNILLLTPDRFQLDLSNEEDCKAIIHNQKPDWIINCAAFTNVDGAESDKEKAYQINYRATEIFSQEIAKVGGKLLQISTDYVFDGLKKRPYEVHDLTNPQNIYGKSKVLAEKVIKNTLTLDNQFLILRTSWVLSPNGKNFLLTILNLLNNKDYIEVVNDQVGCMTSAKYLAQTCWRLIEYNENYSSKSKSFPSLHHWNDQGIVTWYDIAVAIKEMSKKIGIVQNPAEIKSICSNQLKQNAIRPNYSVLDCSKTEEILNIKRINWQESIHEILLSISKKTDK